MPVPEQVNPNSRSHNDSKQYDHSCNRVAGHKDGGGTIRPADDANRIYHFWSPNTRRIISS